MAPASEPATGILTTKPAGSEAAIDIRVIHIPAIHAVLDLYELLENIIAHVPSGQIRKLKGVSKSWKQLIISSPRIRKAQCLVPEDFTMLEVPMPVYEAHSNLQPHPLLDKVHCATVIRRHDTIHGHVYMSDPCLIRDFRTLDDETVGRLRSRTLDYAMLPRCCAIHLSAVLSPARLQSDVLRCLVYVKDGIKIQDLLEVREALKRTFRDYLCLETDRLSQMTFRLGFAERFRS